MNLETNIQYININDIIPNRFQPRLTFDENALRELAESIKAHGIIQPLVLRKLGEDKYEIIAGERRYKASQLAGMDKVPAIIVNLDDNESAEVALVENLQRKNLSAIEEAKSYKKLLDRGYLTQSELAKRMGVSQSSIANKIRLLNLTPESQEALMNEKISERHARSLLQVLDPYKQKELLEKTINERLTVRQLDAEIKKVLESNEEPKYEEFSISEPIESFNFENTDNIKDDEEFDENKLTELILNSKKNLEEKYEIFDIPTAEKSAELETKETNKFESLKDVTDYFKDNIEKVKASGFKIETEDYDFEDLYQIIIKIEK